jgi:hypothetical protein
LIIGPPDWIVGATNAATIGQLRGITGVAQSLPTTPLYQDWVARIPLIWSDQSVYRWSTLVRQQLEANWYDGTLFYAQSIANVLASGQAVTGPNLLAAMKALGGKFTGVTGRWLVNLFTYLSGRIIL